MVRSCTLLIILWQLFVAVEIPLLPSRWRSCADDKPVKLTVELSASAHRNLLAYAEVLARETGQGAEPAKLIEPMLAWYGNGSRVCKNPSGNSSAINRQRITGCTAGINNPQISSQMLSARENGSLRQ
jgi:hypothetical protein